MKTKQFALSLTITALLTTLPFQVHSNQSLPNANKKSGISQKTQDSQKTFEAFLKNAIGKFDFVNQGSSANCPDKSPILVEYFDKNTSLFGKDCGAVIVISTIQDPIGLSFCRVDSEAQNQPITLYYPQQTSVWPAYILASSGREGTNSVQSTATKDVYQITFVDRNVSSEKVTFTATPTDTTITTQTVFENGTVSNSVCRFQRKQQTQNKTKQPQT